MFSASSTMSFDAKSGQLDLAAKEPRANHDHGVQPGQPGTKKIGADVERVEAEGVLGGVVAHASLNGSDGVAYRDLHRSGHRHASHLHMFLACCGEVLCGAAITALA